MLNTEELSRIYNEARTAHWDKIQDAVAKLHQLAEDALIDACKKHRHNTYIVTPMLDTSQQALQQLVSSTWSPLAGLNVGKIHKPLVKFFHIQRYPGVVYESFNEWTTTPGVREVLCLVVRLSLNSEITKDRNQSLYDADEQRYVCENGDPRWHQDHERCLRVPALTSRNI